MFLFPVDGFKFQTISSKNCWPTSLIPANFHRDYSVTNLTSNWPVTFVMVIVIPKPFSGQ